MHAPSVSALGANGPNKSTTAVSLMSTTDSEPPSPTKVPDRYAPSAATVEPRDMSSSNTHSTWSSPVTALAVRVSKLPDSSVNALCGASAGPTRAVYKGLTGTARVIWIEDGMRGLYRGLGPMLLGYIPTWAVYMSTYESTKNVLYPQMG